MYETCEQCGALFGGENSYPMDIKAERDEHECPPKGTIRVTLLLDPQWWWVVQTHVLNCREYDEIATVESMTIIGNEEEL